MTIEQDVNFLRDRVQALESRIRVLEDMIGGPTKSFQSAGGSLVIGPNGISITASGGLEIDAGGNVSITAGGALSLAAGSNLNVRAGGNAQFAVGARYALTAQIASMVVQSSYQLQVSGDASTTVGGGAKIIAGKNAEITSGMDMHFSAKRHFLANVAQRMALMSGKATTIETVDDLKLKAGSAIVEMKKDGNIDIKGKDVTVDASGRINFKASGTLTMKGSNIRQN